MTKLRAAVLVAAGTALTAWFAQLDAVSTEEALRLALGISLVFALPLLGLVLLWDTQFRSSDAWVRYGMSRRILARNRLLRCLGTLALAAVFAAVTVQFSLRDHADPELVPDVLATSAVAVASSLALGSSLAAARVWFGRAAMVALLLLLWTFGSSDLLFSAISPSGHVRALLGLGSPYPVPPWCSFAALYAMTLSCSWLLLAKVPR